MERHDLQRSMYELRAASVAQRLTLAGISGVWVVLAWWLLFGRGLETAGGWFGWVWRAGDSVRRVCLATVNTSVQLTPRFRKTNSVKRIRT